MNSSSVSPEPETPSGTAVASGPLGRSSSRPGDGAGAHRRPLPPGGLRSSSAHGTRGRSELKLPPHAPRCGTKTHARRSRGGAAAHGAAAGGAGRGDWRAGHGERARPAGLGLRARGAAREHGAPPPRPAAPRSAPRPRLTFPVQGRARGSRCPEPRGREPRQHARRPPTCAVRGAAAGRRAQAAVHQLQGLVAVAAARPPAGAPEQAHAAGVG